MSLHGDLAGGAAQRRRDRRLRSWREGSEEVERETYYVPRHQNPPLPGTRPGLLTEPAPQLRLEAASRVSEVGALPTLGLPVLAGQTTDAPLVCCLAVMALQCQDSEPWNAWFQMDKWRTRKKRLPKTSPHSSCGRAHRRQRQFCAWLVPLVQCFSRCPLPLSAGPSCQASWVGMDEKDCCGCALRRLGCGMCYAGYAGYDALFPLVVLRPKMLGIMAGMDQKARCVARSSFRRGFRQWHVQGWYCWFFSPHDVFPSVVGSQMLGVTAGMYQKDSYEATLLLTCLLSGAVRFTEW